MPGLDQDILEALDPDQALRRVQIDVASDFIFAPHLGVIYSKAGDELWDRLASELRSGTFKPQLPIRQEVPKASGFARPAAILWPMERLAYQVAVDSIAQTADKELDRDRVFSYALLEDDSSGFMFESSRKQYTAFAGAIADCCSENGHSHVLKADVASYFDRLYQHVLINSLISADCDQRVVSFLEKLLSAFTEKDSHGILQGLFPSDYLGTFYLCSIDARHQLSELPYFRYADDMYIAFDSEADAENHKFILSSWLREIGLSLNEAKTGVRTAEALVRDETAVDTMFADAREEIEGELDREGFYLSTVLWDLDTTEDDGEEEGEDETDASVDLTATKSLFAVEELESDTRRKVDQFCIRVFSATSDDCAVDYVLNRFARTPDMAQTYARYLVEFIPDNPAVTAAVEGLLADSGLQYDYQLLWVYAALLTAAKVSKKTLNRALKHLSDQRVSPNVRAGCAALVGKFGTASHRRILKEHYKSEASAFVQAAVLYAARHFPKTERDTCFTAWGGHSETNSLIVKAAKRQ